MFFKRMVLLMLVAISLSGCGVLDLIGRNAPGLGTAAVLLSAGAGVWSANEQVTASKATREKNCLNTLMQSNIFLQYDCAGLDRRDMCVRAFESTQRKIAPSICVSTLRQMRYRI